MNLYKVKDWSKHFEVRDSKRVSGPLSWVAVPTKTDGFGFSRISLEKDPCELLAAWYLMLGIAAKQDAEDRGKLQRDGVPLTAEDLAIITRFPVKAFTRALDFFASPKQAWLECVAFDGPCVVHARATDGPSVDASGPSSVPTGQDRTGQDKTETGAAEPLPFSSKEFVEAWDDFGQHRNEIRKPLRPTSRKASLKSLAAIGEVRAIAMLKHTVAMGWQGLREPNANGSQTPKQEVCDFRELKPRVERESARIAPPLQFTR